MAGAPTMDEPLGVLPAGTRLRNYELLSVLGHGSFGITYLARDITLGREVAIKEYLPAALAVRKDGTTVAPRSSVLKEDFDWGRERFLEEARTLATLDHIVAVVRVHDFLEAHGTAYMVMALVRGETLEQRLARDGRLPAPTVERMLGRLLDGLEKVHRVGFLHRDIKPANIILDADDDPVLIDFGAARTSVAGRTVTMTSVYTPRYAAAEQLTSHRQGPWTDIYCLSATFYHAITGAPPPPSVERALEDTCKPLLELAPPGFARALLKGIDAGLALRAADRPQSIESWRRALARADDGADGETITGARPAAGAARRTAADPSVPGPPAAEVASARRAGMLGGKRALVLGSVAFAVVLLGAGGYWNFAPRLARMVEGHKQESEASRKIDIAEGGAPTVAKPDPAGPTPRAPAPADECDRLAQPRRHAMGPFPSFAEGVDSERLDGAAALAACERAAQRYPDEVRFAFLRARALARLGRDAEAVQLYRLATDRDYVQAQHSLGTMYASGRGVEKNDREAVRLYRLAAGQGLPAAQANLGWMYATGRGVAKDDAEAVRLYRLAADQGNAAAQFRLGWMYESGGGVEQNDVEAVRLYRLGAAQGDADAQTNLGWMYENGRGVAKDDPEAVRLYRLAADQGETVAQFNLAVRYENGRGVPKDGAEAIRLYRLAARQGDTDAQAALRRLNETW